MNKPRLHCHRSTSAQLPAATPGPAQQWSQPNQVPPSAHLHHCGLREEGRRMQGGQQVSVASRQTDCAGVQQLRSRGKVRENSGRRQRDACTVPQGWPEGSERFPQSDLGRHLAVPALHPQLERCAAALVQVGVKMAHGALRPKVDKHPLGQGAYGLGAIQGTICGQQREPRSHHLAQTAPLPGRTFLRWSLSQANHPRSARSGMLPATITKRPRLAAQQFASTPRP